MQRMPVGVDDFKKLQDENYYFVDKTSFIQHLLDGHSDVTLITRPRRFGKTLTMSMLDWFFNLEKEKESQDLFKGLDIEKAGSEYMQQRGRVPVIFFTLKGVESDSWEGLYGAFCRCIQWEYQKHQKILAMDALDENDKIYYRKILALEGNPIDIQVSLLQLCRFLALAYGKRPLVLIDEYDAPIQYAYNHDFYKKAIGYFRTWYNNGLKSNPFLYFAVLTGVLRIARESIFSGLNNLKVCSVMNDTYADVFGFTPAEVRAMAVDQDMEDMLPALQKWYDGYHFAGKDIYNPWSIINFFDTKKLDDYWVNTSENSILRLLLHKAEERQIRTLEKLLQGESISVTLNEQVIYENIQADTSALYTLLLTTGYLTVKEASKTRRNRYALCIPNKEIRDMYSTEILNYLVSGANEDAFDNLFDSLFAGDAETFSYELQNILKKFVSSWDSANKESFYHGFMLGMTALFLGSEYKVESNRESGYGRFDLAVFPKNKTKTGVILEFKVAGSENELTVKASEALQQIKDKAYVTEFAKEEIQHVWGYGIAFYGKKIAVTFSSINVYP